VRTTPPREALIFGHQLIGTARFRVMLVPGGPSELRGPFFAAHVSRAHDGDAARNLHYVHHAWHSPSRPAASMDCTFRAESAADAPPIAVIIPGKPHVAGEKAACRWT